MAHPTEAIFQTCDQWAPPLGVLLYDAVIALQAKVVLEIGTNVGDSTRILSTALKETGGHLFSLDNHGCRDAWHLRWDCGNIEFIVNNSLRAPWDKALDLLLINGGHEYETALSDLRRFSPWVRLGGKIFIHDTVLFEPVRRALHEWSVSTKRAYAQYPFGVGLAVVTLTT